MLAAIILTVAVGLYREVRHYLLMIKAQIIRSLFVHQSHIPVASQPVGDKIQGCMFCLVLLILQRVLQIRTAKWWLDF